MRTLLTRRLGAAAFSLVLLTAACGGGDSGSARERLGAAPAKDAVTAPAPDAPETAPAALAAGEEIPAESASATPVVARSQGPAPAAARTAPAAGTVAAPATKQAGAAAGPAGGAERRADGAPAAAAASTTPPAPAPAAPGTATVDPGNRTGVTDDEIVFGMHLPQSGPVGFLVGKAWHGAESYFRTVNAAGGVNGRRIRMVVSDDGYSAQKAAGAIRELVDSKKVFAASCLAGIDQCVVGLEYADAKGVPYLHGGMSETAVGDKSWAYPVTSSYAYGGIRLVDYLFTKRGYTPERKIGAIHVNSPHYVETADEIEARLRHYGSRIVSKHVAEKDQSDFSAAIIKMQNAGVDTVWVFIDPTLLAKFTTQAKALRFTPQYVLSPPTGGDLFAASGGGNLDGAIALATFADPQWAGAAAFRAEFARAYPDEEASEFDLLSYVVAKTFVEGARRAGPELGRSSFAQAMGTIDHFDTGVSSPLSYTKRDRVSAANSTLAVWQIKGTRTDQITGFDF